MARLFRGIRWDIVTFQSGIRRALAHESMNRLGPAGCSQPQPSLESPPWVWQSVTGEPRRGAKGGH